MKVKSYNIPIAVYVITSALLISYFFPREGTLRYQFHEGKPWRYGLLTATSDFPIYKTDAEIKVEKDSVLSTFEPYYRFDQAVETAEIGKLRNTYTGGLDKNITPAYMQYIESSLVKLYKNGLISHQDQEDLHKEGRQRINLLTNNISETKTISDFFTVRTAYEFILNNCPSSLDKNTLQSCNINNFLNENITFDKDMTEKVKNAKLQSVSIANGMVQAGERIVDRGEIVDNYTYNVLRSYKIIYETKSGGAKRQSIILGGQFVLVLGIMFCFWLYLWLFRPRLLFSRRNSAFMFLCVFVSCFLTALWVRYTQFSVYILPYAIIPIVIRTFFDSRTALFAHLIIVLICSLMVPFPHEFLMLQIVTGMVVTFSLKDLSERSQLIRCAFFIFLSYAICYVSMTVYLEADFNKINWVMFLYFGINFVLLMFTYILVYMLEKLFGYVSSITLVELSNINTPLLRKLSENAPGTFQHSLQVSILVSDAAARIGANAQLVRTGAMYHDIGKMTNPTFFTENQSNVDIYKQITPEQSAQIVIGHVAEGVRIAEKAALPKAIIDFIRTHHGKGQTKYFLNTLKNNFPDREINEAMFTYPGPNPFTKETALLMMADSVEAASRSLKKHTEKEIKELVNKIIDSQSNEGLFKNTPLTYRDIETIKNEFIEKLKIMYHTRISYPELKKESGAISAFPYTGSTS